MEMFKFLSDEAVMESSDDRLKHPSIAEALKTIILNAPMPFTIGLFGRWGAGKSTIANFLKKKLNDKQNPIPVIIFDVWKYENDSLRRQFLLDLVNQLKEQGCLNKSFQVDTRLTNPISRTFQGKTTLDKAKLIRFGAILTVILLVLGSCLYFVNPISILPFIASTLTSIIGLIGLAALIQYGTDTITTETETISLDRFKDPDEFEREFSNIVSRTKCERLVIVFDNLDRVTHDKAIELLSTIKTFLEPKTKKCIFLVPCDERAIKTYLESVYTKPDVPNNFDADEFLRKFFNTFIRIPDYISADLEDYTKEQLENTGIEDFKTNTDLRTVITLAFRDNPRQIKQFINTLLSHYLLAFEREKGVNAIIKPSGTITKNPSFLAKILIIKQKWPEFYDKISEDPNTYNNSGDISKYKGLAVFLKGTDITSTTNLRAFIYLKQPSSKLAITGIESENLEIAFKDNNTEEAKRILKSIKSEELEPSKIFEFIKILLNENSGSKQILANIINVTADALSELGINLVDNKDFCELVVSEISDELLEVLPTLPQKFIFNCLSESRKQKVKEIVDGYIGILANAKETSSPVKEPYLTELSQNIVEHTSIFQSNAKEVTDSLKTGAFDNISVLNIFFQSDESIKTYVDAELLQKLMQSITLNDFGQKSEPQDTFGKKMELLFTPHIEMDDATVKEFMKKLSEMINILNQEPPSPENTEYLNQVLKSAEKVVLQEKELIKTGEADNMVRLINESISKISGELERTPFIPLLIFIRDIVGDSNKGLIDTIVNQYGQHGNLEHYQSFIEPYDNETVLVLLQPIKKHIENHGISNIDFFDFIWPYEDEDDKSRIIIDLINRDNFKYATQLLEKESYKVKEEKQIVQNLITKAAAAPPDTREIIFNTIEAMNFANDVGLKQEYINQLEQLYLTTDSALLNLVNNHFEKAKKNISNFQLETLLQNIIDWLIRQQPFSETSRIHLGLIRANWNKIGKEYKEKIQNYLLDQLLNSTISTEATRTITEFIGNIRTPKTKINKYKDSIKTRIEQEQNSELKTFLEDFIAKYE